jgi:hypothetical protein
MAEINKLEAQWAESVPFTFHSALRNLIQNLPYMQMLPTKFLVIWLSSFKGEDFLEIDQSETNCSFRPDPLTNMAATSNSCF